MVEEETLHQHKHGSFMQIMMDKTPCNRALLAWRDLVYPTHTKQHHAKPCMGSCESTAEGCIDWGPL